MNNTGASISHFLPETISDIKAKIKKDSHMVIKTMLEILVRIKILTTEPLSHSEISPMITGKKEFLDGNLRGCIILKRLELISPRKGFSERIKPNPGQTYPFPYNKAKFRISRFSI
jgi:hypothetical protein